MKLLDVIDEGRVYTLSTTEWHMLLAVLGCFPILDHPAEITRTGNPEELAEAQKLLEESRLQRAQAMRADLESWLYGNGRFLRHDGRTEWLIEHDRHEWLLQILNDVRVGSWHRLGAPEDLDAARERPDETAARNLALMEMAGMFQMALLLDKS